MFGAACAFLPLPVDAAGDDEPTSQEQLDKLPVGMKVTHDPTPSRATDTSNRKGLQKYTWFFKTTVQPTDSDVKITEFGAYGWEGGKWVFRTITRKPFTAKDFADWYSCPDALAKKGKGYADTNNWVTGPELVAGKSRWYYIGVDGSGRRVKGEAVSEEKAELDPKRPTDKVGRGPADSCEIVRAGCSCPTRRCVPGEPSDRNGPFAGSPDRRLPGGVGPAGARARREDCLRLAGVDGILKFYSYSFITHRWSWPTPAVLGLRISLQFDHSPPGGSDI
jgi:hypothetical protein